LVVKLKIEHKNFLKRLFYNLNDRNLILTQMEVLNGKKWKFKCSAGINDIVLESDGNLRICELTPKLGSLLESSPEDLLKSERSKKIFEMIKKHDCDCTHICNLSSSMTHSYRNLFVDRLLLDNLKTFKYFK